MAITIGFSTPKSSWAIGAALIRMAERRPYSHAYIMYRHPITEVSLVAQAAHGMVHQVCLGLFLSQNHIVKQYTFQVQPEAFKAYLHFLHLNIGKKYSYKQILWLTWAKLTGKKPSFRNGDGEFDCSEWAARTCEVLGLLNVANEDYITPSDLDKLLEAHSESR